MISLITFSLAMSYPLDEVLTCPFCPAGENADLDILHIGTDCHWVHCSHCQADGPQRHTQEIAVRAWNRSEPRTKRLLETAESEDEADE